MDDEPLIFLQYAQASETAQDYETAIEAEEFLAKAPNNPNAELIEQRVESLKVIVGIDQGVPATRAPAVRGRVGRGIEPLGRHPRLTGGEHMNLDIKTEQAGGDVYVIALTGEIDLYTAPEFKQQLLDVIEKGGKQVVVDLTDTTFIDSTTLGVLVGGVKRCGRTRGSS